MISLKKYLDSTSSQSDTSTPTPPRPVMKVHPEGKALFPVALSAYKSALTEVGDCCLRACPALGSALKDDLRMLDETLTDTLTKGALEAAESNVRERLQDWGKRTALHDQQKTGEVKEILLMMAKTAESVGERDQRCAQQINNVTTSLNKIANLDDLSQIRASIQKNALELKTSIDRMTAEGKAALDGLRKEVSTYQAKLEEAEQIASADSLTGLRSRPFVEAHIERHIAAGSAFCVAILSTVSKLSTMSMDTWRETSCCSNLRENSSPPAAPRTSSDAGAETSSSFSWNADSKKRKRKANV